VEVEVEVEVEEEEGGGGAARRCRRLSSASKVTARVEGEHAKRKQFAVVHAGVPNWNRDGGVGQLQNGCESSSQRCSQHPPSTLSVQKKSVVCCGPMVVRACFSFGSFGWLRIFKTAAAAIWHQTELQFYCSRSQGP
jgi:hypothetical protein